MEKYPVARPIPDIEAEVKKLMISKLPGNRMVQATWAAWCEASQLYHFAHDVITDEKNKDHSDPFLWTNHGQHYAAAMMMRKIANALGIEDVVWKEHVREEVAGGPKDHADQGQPGPGEEGGREVVGSAQG